MGIEENFQELCSLSIGEPNFEPIPVDGNELKIRILKFPLKEAIPSEVTAAFTGLKRLYGEKPPFNFETEILYGELAALRLLQKHGWKGVWVDSYGGKGKKLFLDKMPCYDGKQPKENVEIETKYPDASRVYEAIRNKNVNQKRSDTNGFFDILAWKNGSFAFLEFKKRYEKLRKLLDDRDGGSAPAPLNKGDG